MAEMFGDRLFRLLLRLFPAEFRGDFGDDMAADFRDERAAARRRGLLALARVWWRTVPRLILAVAHAWLDDLLHDLRFAVRTMGRSPGFTAAAVLMLAVGTGSNAAMFSIVDAVLLRTAFDDPDHLVVIQEQGRGRPIATAIPMSHLEALQAAPQFAGVSGVTGLLAVLTGVGEPHRIDIECVSAAMFPLLGRRPLLGRTFSVEEDRSGAPPVVVLGYRTWQQDFGGATDIVGRTITLNGMANTVIGVMPDGFLGPFSRNRTAGWAPFEPARVHQSGVGCRAGARVNAIARVKRPLTPETAAIEIDASGIVARLPLTDGTTGAAVHLVRSDDVGFDGVRTPFLALIGAVACVLLIACANVANLQLERLVGRRREIAVRLALGASRGRIVRQTLAENLLLSVLGAAAGLVAARLTLQTLVAMIPTRVPHVAEITINGRTLVVTLTAAVAAGVGVGLVPALHTSSRVLADDLKSSSRAIAGSGQWLRRALVVIEVALSVVLLIGAALMVRTFLTLRPLHPGFDVSNRVVAQTMLSGRWEVDRGRERFLDDVLAGVGALPGVVSVSGSSYLPMHGMSDSAVVRLGETTGDVWAGWITPSYVSDMNIPLVRGRAFTAGDTHGAPPVALINETLVRQFWPQGDPLGQIIEVRAPDGSRTTRQIVGILRDTRSWGIDLERHPELYVPFAQQPGSTLFYVIVRTAGSPDPHLPAQIRAIVSAVRPGQVVDSVEPLQDALDRSVAQPRFGAWLFGTFGAMAVGLAGLGLGAVMAWWVAQRTREIGVRIALGAGRAEVVRLVVSQGLLLAVSGAVAGLALAAFASRLLAGWLYGVDPLDPATFAGSAVFVLIVSALSSYLPARRAATIDPIVALRAE